MYVYIDIHINICSVDPICLQQHVMLAAFNNNTKRPVEKTMDKTTYTITAIINQTK